MIQKFRAAVPITLTALAGAIGALSGRPVAAIVVACAVALTVVIVTAWPPRRAAILLVAVLSAGLPFTGVGLGPIVVSELCALLVLVVTVLPGASPEVHTRPRGSQVLTGAALIVFGGTIALLTSAGSRVGPLLHFALGAVPVTLAVWRLRPARREVATICLGLLAGTLVSALAGIFFIQEAGARAMGLALHPNQLAMTAVLALPLTILVAKRGRLNRTSAVLSAAVLIAAVLMSGSRSGLIALGVLGVLVALRFAGAWRAGFCALLILIAFVAFGPPGISTSGTERLFNPSETTRSDELRAEAFAQGFERIESSFFVLGGGIPDDSAASHNIVLYAWGGFGLMGLAGFLLVAWRVARGVVSRRTPTTVWLLTAGSIAFLVAVSANNALGVPFAWLIFSLKEELMPGPPGACDAFQARGHMEYVAGSINHRNEGAMSGST